jgi:hypothetical protein
LSNSLNPELSISPAQRRKALAGRILELSGDAKLGKGKKRVLEQERNSAAKCVREGLIERQKVREKQELEEVSLNFVYGPDCLTSIDSDCDDKG